MPNISAGTMTTPSSSRPAGHRPAVDKTNPFVGLDISGFEPIGVTVGKRTGQGDKVKKWVPGPPKPTDHRKPLGHGESLWDPRINRIRFLNIVAGWVKPKTT
ncbi:hypothetical protein BDW02DRAFT_600464 [Decorospora gaudefroyi]|uniref:Uncharacterized protein n=1 Tax=Decorospora gaudefroyi TaxID=184978 RepID=A0A6A5KBK8_9PLEO|nr:hypothetical protein BDW02DRAFT_600464 [Decorospora gaudefroyi]